MTTPKPPEKRPDRHYNFRQMNVVFAASSLALLAVTLWMVFADYARPWKRIQAEFRDLERQEVLAELRAERQRISDEQIAAVEGEIAAEEERLSARRQEIEELEDAISTLDKRVYEADAEMRTTKSYLDAAKYDYDLALQSGGAKVDRAREKVEALNAQWQENRKALEERRRYRDDSKSKLAEQRAGVRASEKKLEGLREALDSLELQVANLSKDINYFMLNAPLMDFLQPTLKIEQIILPGLFHDINFTTIDRVDRCMTCHLAANRAGFDGDGWGEPYRSHPNLDLFVGDGSPHPYGEFGCTACHAGLDRATDFARAGHSPIDREQRELWEEKWGWNAKAQKWLHTPIHAAPLSEAGCISCHAGEVWTPRSQVQDVGRQVIFKMGCYGCHAIDYPAFRDLPKPGPDLIKVASKTNPGWAGKWIEAPREFRPTTWMPHFFYLENIKGERNLKRQKAEIAAIVAFLFDRSEAPEHPPAPDGDLERGRELFETIGCTGCHVRDGEAARDQFYPEFNRLHGPNLYGLGSKVSRDWLYAWLKNPKQYRPDTPMPDLRLTDQEAADLAAFLMTSRNPEYEDLPPPISDPTARAGLALSYLQNTLTIQQSEARLDRMSEHDQNVYLGEQTVAKYGCFACHNIAGFADAKPIGVELTEEGSKPLHLFDFGHVHDVEHTRHGWILTKLERPRVWDEGKELVKEYGELYKMPDFGMSDREANAVAGNVLGFTKESVRTSRKAAQSARSAALAKGRRLVTRYNCRGCHLIEAQGQAIRTSIEDVGMLPPNLAAEGARVQSDWLFGFLHDPSQEQLRPWLTVRMPTFDFSDEEANAVVEYFAALDHRDTFLSEAPVAQERELAVGEEIFNMLQCARCHPAGAEALAAVGGGSAELAPSLLLGPERLRHDWVAPWIKDPQSWIPGTKMPTNFPRQESGEYQSPLVGVIDAPMFRDQARRMMRYFSSEEELRAYLGDVDKVTAALRDYIWTLGG